MKKLIYILIILLFGKYTKAQTFTVGSTCCNYNLVNKTFTTSVFPTTPLWGSTDFYSIDVDGDLVADVIINSSFVSVPPASGYKRMSISVTSTTSTEFVYTPIITGFYNQLIDNVSFGTSLISSLNWKLTPTTPSVNSAAPLVYEYFYKYSPSYTYTVGTQTNPFYIGFRKILPSTDTIYGWIRMDSNFPGKVIDYAYTCGTYTGTPPTSTITTSPVSILKCDSLLLSATPGGGVFYGTGVSSNYFKSKNLAAGVYTVNYALPNPAGCSISSSAITVTVTGAAFTSTQTILCVGESLTLTAQPSGGVFAGTDISSNVFSPLSVGTYSALYTYASPLGCSLTTSITLTANSCVGINEIDNLNSLISIYPNPANDKLNIYIHEFNNINQYNFKLVSVEGKELKSGALMNSQTEIDVSDLSNGIYFVEIGHWKIFARRKLIVIH